MIEITALALLALAVGQASAQRPDNTSVCDYYVTALLKDNNATNQEALVRLVVNTAVIGNFTPNDANINVPGILGQNQTYSGTKVNLLPYFDGSLASSNRGGKEGVAINFLDDGGAEPLTKGKPSDSDSSQQFKLMTHLYEYFGILLGCSLVGKPGYPAYDGAISMYQVHKFMALDPYDFGYFVEQVALSAASFGVAQADLEYVGTALNGLFGHRCSGMDTFMPGATPALETICITVSNLQIESMGTQALMAQQDDCPQAANASCSSYEKVVEPKHANGSAVASGTHHPSGTGAPAATSSKASGADLTRKMCGSLMVMFALGTVYWLM
ncbi:hypothetical protein LTR56_009998 [Elasticomyces elasticus]|nr:hypothetical protein LTR56_009998 [Elasticomyces elasticus]KAK3665064.1 hypothetical protein LTR22_004120 [Elasticomyces elasticus]KAK4931561.1 hypothetical protein LTR49_001949 [Elasticomyces elasticus]KAK5766721.1 hypothetical protein LTS12_003070 [Elasticomyces elasticus]